MNTKTQEEQKFLPKRILQVRESMNISQKAFGALIGTSDKTVCAYEKGRCTPPLETLQIIAEITQQPLTYFTHKVAEANTNQILNKLTDIEKVVREIKQIFLSSPLKS